MSTLLIGVSVFFATIIFVLLGVQTLKSATTNYQEHFVTSANANLSDMFIFIEPQKLYMLMVFILVFSFGFLWLYFNSFIPALIIAVVLAFLPRFIYKFLKNMRLKRFNLALPDALNSISTMLRAGTNLPSAVEMMVVESKGAISQEFDLLMREIKMGKDFDDALDSAYERMPSDDFALVVAGIKISREVGGSLAEVLQRLAETIRRRLEMEGKIDSLTAMGKAQGFVMAMLPLALAYIISKIEPEAMSELYTTPMGWVVCAVVVVMEILGFFVIRKIVNIDV